MRNRILAFCTKKLIYVIDPSSVSFRKTLTRMIAPRWLGGYSTYVATKLMVATIEDSRMKV